jgi:hypothetical protein
MSKPDIHSALAYALEYIKDSTGHIPKVCAGENCYVLEVYSEDEDADGEIPLCCDKFYCTKCRVKHQESENLCFMCKTHVQLSDYPLDANGLKCCGLVLCNEDYVLHTRQCQHPECAECHRSVEVRPNNTCIGCSMALCDVDFEECCGTRRCTGCDREHVIEPWHPRCEKCNLPLRGGKKCRFSDGCLNCQETKNVHFDKTCVACHERVAKRPIEDVDSSSGCGESSGASPVVKRKKS